MVDAKAVRSESRRSAGGDCNWRGAVKSKQLMAVQSERGEEGERKQMVPVRNQVSEGDFYCWVHRGRFAIGSRISSRLI